MAKDINKAKDYEAAFGLFLLSQLKEKTKYMESLGLRCHYSFSIKSPKYDYNKHAVSLAIQTLDRMGYILKENTHYVLYSTGQKEYSISFSLSKKDIH